jgi:hypothetical protein
MARFTGGSGGGSGAAGPQGPAGPAGQDANTGDFVFENSSAIAPGDISILSTTAPGTITLSAYAGVGIQTNEDFGLTANKIVLTNNGATNNITIGDDVILGDGNVANHVVIIGQQDAESGGIVLGTNETEFVSTNGTDLSLTAQNDIVLYPGSTYAYLNVIDEDHRLATMADITGGSGADTGDITFVDSTISSDTGNNIVIQNKNADGIVKARITLDQSDEQVRIEAIDGRNEYFDSNQWDTAVWSGNVVTITNTPDIIDFFSNTPGDITKVSINDGTALNYEGGSFGGGNTTIYVSGAPAIDEDPLTITEIRFLYQVVSQIDIDYDNEEFLIQSRGMDLNLNSDQEINLESDDDIDLRATNRARIYGDTNVFLNSENGGVFIGTSVENGNVNQVATLGDIEQAIETGPSEVSFFVSGGTLGDQPTFTGDPLFSGSYVKTGPLVHFQIQVDMDNITSFGTGQYYVDLPFTAKYGYQVKEGCLHDVSTGKQYAIGGHVYAGEVRLNLTFTNTNGQDEPFDFNSPVVLTTEDNFHIAGTYISN